MSEKAIEGKTFIRTKDGYAGCVKHNGEHPFHYKETVNALVTYCHEVLLATEENKQILFHPKPTLEDYRSQIKRDKCDCGHEGLKSLHIEHYPHGAGWPVQGFPELQWLYVTCPKCKYEWALWKLGVPR